MLQEIMSTSDNTQQTNQEVQELTDDNLKEVSGGIGALEIPYVEVLGEPSPPSVKPKAHL